MAGFFNLMNEWTIRAAVLVSFGAHIVLLLFAGIRRREASGWRTLVLWLAYLVADWAAKYALSNALSNLSRSSMSHQQQLVAFWMPFLLTHLGGPDNITAYSLEDNKLSRRQAVSTVLQVLGTLFVIYRQIYISGGEGTLLGASIVMVAVGVAKYFERALALRKSDFGNIRRARKKSKSLKIQPHHPRNLNNEDALLVAHDLLHITKGAFADYSVIDGDPVLFPYGWKDLCKVVEMELSLMYDIIYTKATVIHTWGGYLLRVASLIATAAATLMFCFYSKHGQRRVDVIITYILLIATFLLDVRWLLRAAASTWTYAFLMARPWLCHEVWCSGRWRWLRRVVVSLDPQRLIRRDPSGGYRLWAGSIGQYNLLQECQPDATTSLLSRLVKWVASEDIWMEYKYSRGLELHASKHVKKLLFKKIKKALKPVTLKMEEPAPPLCTAAAIFEVNIEQEQEIAQQRRRVIDEALGFFPEFQELILIWHVATYIFLLGSHEYFSKDPHVDAIKAVSNYLVFLVVVRPDMLPGLKLRSLYDTTRRALQEKWPKDADLVSIARILRKENKKKLPGDHKNALYRSSMILSDGTTYAEVLLARLRSADWDGVTSEISEKSKETILFLIPELQEEYVPHVTELLDFVLESWVRMLVYVSTRCGRDSHAKQLCRGSELTTIVWILREHGITLRI